MYFSTIVFRSYYDLDQMIVQISDRFFSDDHRAPDAGHAYEPLGAKNLSQIHIPQPLRGRPRSKPG
jgi:hypothetical protein